MIPILYEKNEQNFSHNGIGYLTETVKAVVTEERNGSYELSMQYPVTGKWFDKITIGTIIKAKPNETSDLQLFRVYKASKPLNGIVTYSAEHISYMLNGIPLAGFSVHDVTPQEAMNRAISEGAFSCPFFAVSDITTLNGTTIDEPCSVRSFLGGRSGSVLDVWGGEYEFDNYVIRLHANRGTDNGVTIEYGKNLTDIKQEENISECYTHLLPYAMYTVYPDDDIEGIEGEEVYVYLPEKVIPISNAANIGHSKAYIMDFSDSFAEGEQITEAALRTKATAHAQRTDLGTPKVNITVSFVQLWQSEEYKNIAPLERVKLCDTVTVRFPMLGINASAKVIKTVYDVLLEKYESVTIGDAKNTLIDTISKARADITRVRKSVQALRVKTSNDLNTAIKQVTRLIDSRIPGM